MQRDVERSAFERIGRQSRGRGGNATSSSPPRLIALLLLALLLPSVAPQSAVAQDEQPPIVPVVDEEPVAVIDGEPVAGVEDPGVAPVEDPGIAPEADPGADLTGEPASVVTELAPPPSVPAPAPAVDWAPPRTVYIPETGHSIDGVFLDVWRAWGGALSWGYPITPEFEANGHIVQYYAFGRFEYWPEDPNGNVVHFGELGAEMRPHVIRRGLPGSGPTATQTALAARAWLPLDSDEVEPDSADWRFVPETKHGVAGAIKAIWGATGEASYLGNPLTEAYVVDGVTYEVFERGKVAQEPGGQPYLLPIGELMAARYQLDTTPMAQGDLPIYSEDLFVPPPAPTLTGVTVDPNAEKWIRVSLSQQYLWAMQGDVAVWEGYISTGTERFETPAGSYRILTKLESQTMEGVLGGEYYNVPDVPWVMYFTDWGHALHGTYWHSNFGTPMSHGCVNLPMDVAAWMYQWAPLGARVEIVP